MSIYQMALEMGEELQGQGLENEEPPGPKIPFFAYTERPEEVMTRRPMGVARSPCEGATHVNESDPGAIVFDQFCTANTFQGIMSSFQQLCDIVEERPEDHVIFYQRLKHKLTSWKAQSLWAKLDKRAGHREYRKGTCCLHTRVMLIGGGPCGLRTAIEIALLGGKAVVTEKRDRFSRNNVLHLWPFLITDLKALGAKKFFGKFCAGAIDHISIRALECILLKVALLVGVEVHPGVAFEDLRPPAPLADQECRGWRAQVSPADHPLSEYEFDVLIGADGKRNTLQGFRRKEFRGKLAIAITANFINRNTAAEARVEEISGVAFIFNQKFFKDMYAQTGIDLENIVYYKDDTHYFVMTAKKHSLLLKGVLIQDYEDPARLLSKANVDQEALLAYAMEAADVSTRSQLPNLEFAHNHYGQPDVAMFDFTSMFAAEHASRMIERHGYKLLIGLVGDSLLEPFWPTGSGLARGFLGVHDAAWMIRSWASGKMTPLEVMAERESIYQLLSQTTPENISKIFLSYTIDPNTRYPNLNPAFFKPHQVTSQYDGDNPEYLNQIVQVAEQQSSRYEMMRDTHNLVKWFQRQLEGYRHIIKILDLSSSWQSGLALCALIHKYRPELIDVYSLDHNKVAENNQLAFDIAEREFGIQAMTTGEAMVNYQLPDKLAMSSYLSHFFEFFRKESIKPVKVVRPLTARVRTKPRSPASKLALLSKMGSRIRQRRSVADYTKRLMEAKPAVSDYRREYTRVPQPMWTSSDEEDQQYKCYFEEFEKENETDFLKRPSQKPISALGTAQKRIKDMEPDEPPSAMIKGYKKLEGLEPEPEESKVLRVRREMRALRAGVRGQNKVSALAKDLAGKFKGEGDQEEPEKKTNPRPLIPRNTESDACYFCKQTVYLVERHSAEGLFFHRGCFRCEYCSTNLRVGGYSCLRTPGGEVKFYCHQHYGLKKPFRRPPKRTYGDGENTTGSPALKVNIPNTASLSPVGSSQIDGAMNKTPERIEYVTESEQEESELEQTQHNLSASLLDEDSESESSSDEMVFEDGNLSEGEISLAELAKCYSKKLLQRKKKSSEKRTDSGSDTETGTVGASDADWESGSDTERESDTESLYGSTRKKSSREMSGLDRSKEESQESNREKMLLSPTALKPFGYTSIYKAKEATPDKKETKPSPTTAAIMRNRMAFFSVVSEPVRIDAQSFLGLRPPPKREVTPEVVEEEVVINAEEGSSGEKKKKRKKRRHRRGDKHRLTGEVEESMLPGIQQAAAVVNVGQSDDDESTDKVEEISTQDEEGTTETTETDTDDQAGGIEDELVTSTNQNIIVQQLLDDIITIVTRSESVSDELMESGSDVKAEEGLSDDVDMQVCKSVSNEGTGGDRVIEEVVGDDRLTKEASPALSDRITSDTSTARSESEGRDTVEERDMVTLGNHPSSDERVIERIHETHAEENAVSDIPSDKYSGEISVGIDSKVETSEVKDQCLDINNVPPPVQEPVVRVCDSVPSVVITKADSDEGEKDSPESGTERSQTVETDFAGMESVDSDITPIDVARSDIASIQMEPACVEEESSTGRDESSTEPYDMCDELTSGAHSIQPESPTESIQPESPTESMEACAVKLVEEIVSEAVEKVRSEARVGEVGQEMSDISKQEVSDISKQEVGVITKQEVSDITKQEVSDISKQEVGILTKQEVSDISKQEVSVITRQEVSDIIKQEVSDIDKPEMSHIVKQEVNDMAKQEMSDIMDKPGTVSIDKCSDVDVSMVPTDIDKVVTVAGVTTDHSEVDFMDSSPVDMSPMDTESRVFAVGPGKMSVSLASEEDMEGYTSDEFEYLVQGHMTEVVKYVLSSPDDEVAPGNITEILSPPIDSDVIMDTEGITTTDTTSSSSWTEIPSQISGPVLQEVTRLGTVDTSDASMEDLSKQDAVKSSDKLDKLSSDDVSNGLSEDILQFTKEGNNTCNVSKEGNPMETDRGDDRLPSSMIQVESCGKNSDTVGNGHLFVSQPSDNDTESHRAERVSEQVEKISEHQERLSGDPEEVTELCEDTRMVSGEIDKLLEQIPGQSEKVSEKSDKLSEWSPGQSIQVSSGGEKLSEKAEEVLDISSKHSVQTAEAFQLSEIASEKVSKESAPVCDEPGQQGSGAAEMGDLTMIMEANLGRAADMSDLTLLASDNLGDTAELPDLSVLARVNMDSSAHERVNMDFRHEGVDMEEEINMLSDNLGNTTELTIDNLGATTELVRENIAVLAEGEDSLSDSEELGDRLGGTVELVNCNMADASGVGNLTMLVDANLSDPTIVPDLSLMVEDNKVHLAPDDSVLVAPSRQSESSGVINKHEVDHGVRDSKNSDSLTQEGKLEIENELEKVESEKQGNNIVDDSSVLDKVCEDDVPMKVSEPCVEEEVAVVSASQVASRPPPVSMDTDSVTKETTGTVTLGTGKKDADEVVLESDHKKSDRNEEVVSMETVDDVQSVKDRSDVTLPIDTVMPPSNHGDSDECDMDTDGDLTLLLRDNLDEASAADDLSMMVEVNTPHLDPDDTLLIPQPITPPQGEHSQETAKGKSDTAKTPTEKRDVKTMNKPLKDKSKLQGAKSKDLRKFSDQTKLQAKSSKDQPKTSRASSSLDKSKTESKTPKPRDRPKASRQSKTPDKPKTLESSKSTKSHDQNKTPKSKSHDSLRTAAKEGKDPRSGKMGGRKVDRAKEEELISMLEEQTFGSPEALEGMDEIKDLDRTQRHMKAKFGISEHRAQPKVQRSASSPVKPQPVASSTPTSTPKGGSNLERSTSLGAGDEPELRRKCMSREDLQADAIKRIDDLISSLTEDKDGSVSVVAGEPGERMDTEEEEDYKEPLDTAQVISFTVDDEGNHKSYDVDEKYVNLRDRRRRKNSSKSSVSESSSFTISTPSGSIASTSSVSELQSGQVSASAGVSKSSTEESLSRSKPTTPLEDSISLDKLVEINMNSDDLLDDLEIDAEHLTLDMHTVKKDTVNNNITKYSSPLTNKSIPTDSGTFMSPIENTPFVSANSTALTESSCYYTPETSGVSPVINSRIKAQENTPNSSPSPLIRHDYKSDTGRSSDALSDASDHKSHHSNKSDHVPSSPYSPGRLKDAKWKFFSEAATVVRMDHNKVFSDIPNRKTISPNVAESNKKNLELNSEWKGLDSGTPTSPTAAVPRKDAASGEHDVFYTPATSMKDKHTNGLTYKDGGLNKAEVRKRLLPATPSEQSKKGLTVGELRRVKELEQEKTKTAAKEKADEELLRKKRPESAMGRITKKVLPPNKRPMSATADLKSDSSTLSSTDSPLRVPSDGASTSDQSGASPNTSRKGKKGKKSKEDKENREADGKKEKKRSFLSLLLPSRSVERKERERPKSPPVDKPEKTSFFKTKSPPIGKDRSATQEKKKSLEHQGAEKQGAVLRGKAPQTAPDRLAAEQETTAEQRRSMYDEFANLVDDLTEDPQRNKEDMQERLQQVAPPPAKAPYTSLRPPTATMDEWDTESDAGDDKISVRSFQAITQGMTEEELAKVLKKQQKAVAKRQREAELKRLRMAQEIQRHLEEVEFKQRQVEEKGVAVERALRGEGKDGDESELMQQWFNIVHEKNTLVRYESELMVHARELELEDRQGRLEHQLRELIALDEDDKTLDKREEEKKVLEEILEVVEQRDALVALLEEDRLKPKEAPSAKDYNL